MVCHNLWVVCMRRKVIIFSCVLWKHLWTNVHYKVTFIYHISYKIYHLTQKSIICHERNYSDRKIIRVILLRNLFYFAIIEIYRSSSAYSYHIKSSDERVSWMFCFITFRIQNRTSMTTIKIRFYIKVVK